MPIGPNADDVYRLEWIVGKRYVLSEATQAYISGDHLFHINWTERKYTFEAKYAPIFKLKQLEDAVILLKNIIYG